MLSSSCTSRCPWGNSSTPITAGPASGGLTEKCRFYLANGLASSTRQVYASAQRQFFEFCNQDVSFSQSWPPLPASEQILMRFCTHLADRLHHSSIKVYLSAVRSLHIDYGFSDPLPNCLQLQHLLRGIKHHQGSNLTHRQSVTADLVSVLHRSLDLANPDNVMLWAACCVDFFGFLRGGEFTVNSPFDPSLHLTLDDMQVDAPLNPQSVCVFIKCSKTDPFQKGCFVFLGRGSAPLCPVVSLVNYFHLCGPGPGPLFLYQDGTPLSRSKLSAFLKSTPQSAGVPGNFTGHSFRIGAATTAASRGIPDHLIKTMGRWSSEAHLLYVRTPVDTLLSVASQLA